jgi:pSer/pThr/pTyr-binding forkhead associated (FHA) protein
MAKLVLLSEGLTGKSYELKDEKTTIGRLDDNTFPITDPSVSSHHLEILKRGNEIVVKDLNSTNGTFINGEKVTGEAVLKPGQILRLGSIDIRLETPDMAAAADAKKPLDQTRAIPRGVQFDSEQGKRPVFDKGSPFAKKSTKTAVIFITIGIVLGVIIVVSIFIAMQKMR